MADDKNLAARLDEMIADLQKRIPDGYGGERSLWPEEKEALVDFDLLHEILVRLLE